MDVKKLGRIPDGGGWRTHGEEHREPPTRLNKTVIGYDYIHSSSMTTPGSLIRKSSPTRRVRPARRSCERAIAYFHGHGITRIERLITDNAWAYR